MDNADVATFFECSDNTIRRRVEMLVQSGDLNEPHFCVSLNVPNKNKTQLLAAIIAAFFISTIRVDY